MFTFKRLWLTRDKNSYQQWARLMADAGLDPHEEVDYTIGVFNERDQLVATGSYKENIIKCLAVAEAYRSEDLLTKVLTHLLDRLQEDAIQHLFLYTKPCEEARFTSLGFKKIVASEQVLFMEWGSPDISQYQAMLKAHQTTGTVGAIVANANPFTKGHQFLVESAAATCDHVFVFVLSEDRSQFSTQDRLNMVIKGVSHLANVTVLPTNNYMVSSATFPTYFLKERAPLALAQSQATVDALVFKEKIASILNIRYRFVGEEPFSEVTELYNQTLQKIFGDDLKLVIIPRTAVAGIVVSATKVREALAQHDLELVKQLVPSTTFEYITKGTR